MILSHQIDAENTWELCKSRAFWGEIAPHDHVVQIYDDKEIFLETLVDFVGNGINAGDCVVVIAKADHLQALHQVLRAHAIKVDALISEDKYIPLDAEEMLDQFMIDGWPDEGLFSKVVYSLIDRARVKNRQLKAFGEMVAILWEQGHYGATVHLEHLWNKICAEDPFCLFCAYPKSGFTQDPVESMRTICAAHTKVIAGDAKLTSHIAYRNVVV